MWQTKVSTVGSAQLSGHVDDFKISQSDPAVVMDMIKLLQCEFGKETPLTIVHGKVHEYLGIKINFNALGKVQFTMEEYVKGVIDEAPGDMSGESPTPTPNHLFTVNTESQPCWTVSRVNYSTTLLQDYIPVQPCMT